MSLLVLIIIATITAYFILTYHRLMTQLENARHNQKQIDTQLDKRFKLFETLIQEINTHVVYEQTALKEVMNLRRAAEQAKLIHDDKTRIAAENQISDIANHLGILFEQHVDLKNHPRCAQLRMDISNTENKLAYAKHAYNHGLEIYQSNKNTFPANLLLNIFRDTLDKNLFYWQASDEQEKMQEAYSVQL